MKIIFFVILFILSFFLSACEEEFNPKTDFKEKYALFGVISNYPQTPSSGLTVTVLKTYDIEGFNPALDHTDHSVAGCIVTLIVNDKEYRLNNESSNDTTNPFRTKYSYSINGFNIPSNQELKIKAELPNGHVLTSRTSVPVMLSVLEFSYPFNSGVHSKLNRFIWGDKWIINWDSFFNDYLYFPRLILNYEIKTASSHKYFSKEIPLKYIKKNGRNEPVFPSYTWDKQTEYSFDCFDSVMTQISAGDTAKKSYIIRSVVFGMLEYENNLANYFSSTNGYLDNFSIRLDETVYSNISGGIGVFGGYTRMLQTFRVERGYVESFGYTWREP